MSRWSFLLLGGDISQPHVRRMAWRVGLSSVALGFLYGIHDVGLQPAAGRPAMLIAGATAVFAVFLANEYRHFYQRSDELVRRTLVGSLAVAGVVVMAAAGLYGVFELLFPLPPLPMIVVFLFATVVSSAAWMMAAWKTS